MKSVAAANSDAHTESGKTQFCKRFVAVLGPDGSGKTTVIENLVQQLRARGQESAVFHWRPQFRRNGGAPIVVADPHCKPPRSRLASVLKLAYLVWKFNIGYWWSLRPLLARDKVVIFDRYFHDVLIDPVRYRYGAPAALAQFCGTFVPKPDVWIVLDAPLELLRQRKQEVTEGETARQRNGYARLARELENGHLVDASQSPEKVADVIVQLL